MDTIQKALLRTWDDQRRSALPSAWRHELAGRPSLPNAQVAIVIAAHAAAQAVRSAADLGI
jgi:hypothetical protein